MLLATGEIQDTSRIMYSKQYLDEDDDELDVESSSSSSDDRQDQLTEGGGGLIEGAVFTLRKESEAALRAAAGEACDPDLLQTFHEEARIPKPAAFLRQQNICTSSMAYSGPMLVIDNVYFEKPGSLIERARR
jgi:hypothetical protein